MKKIKLILLLLAALFIHEYANAQAGNNPGEAFIQQAAFEHNEAVKQFTSDFVAMFELDFDAFSEFGDESNVAILNMYGNSNSSEVQQSGWGNRALINILGDRNTTGLEQRGNNNRFILNLEGNDSVINSEQKGTQNQMKLNLAGTFPNQNFSQRGSNHTIELIDNGNGGVPMEIEQRGNGASVIIENY